MSAQSADKGGHQPENGILSDRHHVLERGKNGHAVQLLAFGEAYREGRLEIRFLVEGFEDFCSFEIDDEVTDRAHMEVVGQAAEFVATNQASQLGHSKHDCGSHGHDEMVLVAFVENLDGIEIKLPARIRLEVMYLVDDLFGGEVHLSCRDGTTKTLTASLGEGEANASRVLCLVAHHPEAKVVQGGAKVVDSIAEDESEMIWDGMLGLDVNQSLRGIFALPNSKLERLCLKVFGYLPVQVQDVVLGPLNF